MKLISNDVNGAIRPPLGTACRPSAGGVPEPVTGVR